MAVTINVGDNFATVIAANPSETVFNIATGIHRNQSLSNITRANLVLQGEANAPMPVITGGTIIDGLWTKVSSVNRWYIDGISFDPTSFTSSYSPWYQTGYQRSCENNVLVTFNGVQARHRDNITDVNGNDAYYFDFSANRLYIGRDPAVTEVEMSTTTYFLTGSVNNVTVRGLVIQMYANAPQTGAIYSRNTSTSTYGSGWLIERCTFIRCNGCGVRMGNNMTVRYNLFAECGQMGLHGAGVASPVLRGNDFYGHNTKGFDYGWEAAAFKLSTTTDAVVEDNRFYNNLGKGAWFDVHNIRAVFRNNVVYDNDDDGAFYELSEEASFSYNDARRNGKSFEGELKVRDSIDVDVVGNYCVGDPTITSNWVLMVNQGDSFRQYVKRVRVAYNDIVLKASDARYGMNIQADGDQIDIVYNKNRIYVPTLGDNNYRQLTLVPSTNTSISFATWQSTYGNDLSGSESNSAPAGHTNTPAWPKTALTYRENLLSLRKVHRAFFTDEASGSPLDYSPNKNSDIGSLSYNGTMAYQNKAFLDGTLVARFTRANSNRCQFNNGNWQTGFNKNSFTYNAWFSLADPAGTTTQRFMQFGSTGGAGNMYVWVGKTLTANQCQAIIHLNNTSYTRTFTISDTNWHHVRMTSSYASGTGRIEIYVDGVDLGGFDHIQDASGLTMTSTASIGSSGTSNHFDGWLYGCVLYNTAYTNAECAEWLYNCNRKPVVTGIADRTDNEGASISIAVTASGETGETLTYSAEGLPTGLSINSSTGAITGTIGSSAAGRWRPLVTVTDNNTPSNRNNVLNWDWIVVDVASAPSISRIALIDADTDTEITGYTTLTDGASINLATLGVTNITMRVHTSPSVTGSVKFGLVNGLVNNSTYRIENVAPYALAGDTSSGTDYNAWTDYQLNVSNALTVTPYSASGAAGSAGTPVTINFTVIAIETVNTSAGSGLASGLAPTLTRGNASLTTSTGEALASGLNPTPARGNVTLTTSTGDALASGLAPTLSRGSATLTSASGDTLASGVAPTLSRGNVSITASSGEALASGINPTVIREAVTLTTSTGEILASGLAATVTRGAATATTTVGDALASGLNPTATKESYALTTTEGESLASGFVPALDRGAVSLDTGISDTLMNGVNPSITGGGLVLETESATLLASGLNASLTRGAVDLDSEENDTMAEGINPDIVKHALIMTTDIGEALAEGLNPDAVKHSFTLTSTIGAALAEGLEATLTAGNVTLTSILGAALAEGLAPTFVVGNVTLPAAPGEALASGISPTQTRGDAALDTAAAAALAEGFAPDLAYGSVTLTTTIAVALANGVAPVNVRGSATVTTTAGALLGLALNPNIDVGAFILTTTSGEALAEGIAPDLVWGDVVLITGVGEALVSVIDPSIIIPVPIMGFATISIISAGTCLLTIEPLEETLGEQILKDHSQRFKVTVTDLDGGLITPTELTVRLKRQSGDIAVNKSLNEMTQDSDGSYYFIYAPDASGRWRIHARALGSGATYISEEIFDVAYSDF